MMKQLQALKFKRKGWIVTTLIVLLCPMLANVRVNETLMLGNSALWNLLSLIPLIQAGRKIAGKDHQGWLWLAAFIYAEAWTVKGIAAWICLAAAGWAVYTAGKWALSRGTLADTPSEETDENGFAL